MTQIAYAEADWPNGLRCSNCDREFTDGEPLYGRFLGSTGSGHWIGEVVCGDCRDHMGRGIVRRVG